MIYEGCVCGGEKKEGKSKSQLHSCTNEIWKLSHPNLEVSPTQLQEGI
jgi:hypothetical protein